MYRIVTCFALTLVFATSAVNVSCAESNTVTSATTTITLKVLSCEGCAKRVRDKLLAVNGVGHVKTDLTTNSATVMHKRHLTPSPKRLWQAVEQAGKTPVKLIGPSGTFTSRPN